MNKSKEQLIRFTFISTAAIFWLLIVPANRAAEPIYNGRALSEWLITLHASPSDEEVIAATKQNVNPTQLVAQKESRAREAIRQMGTNSLHTLLDLVSVGEGNRRSVARRIKSKDIQESLRNSKPDFREAVRGMAVEGFAILGTDSEPVIPQLTKLLRENAECRLDVANVLAQIGPKGFAVLTNAINDEDLAGVLVLAIGQKGGGDVQTITRLLIQALKSSNPTTRGNAADFLSGKDATLAVPALISVLDDSDAYPRRFAAHTLGGFGSAAKIAAPKLLSVYTNTIAGSDKRLTGDTGIFLLEALKNIDRDAAGQAETFLVNSGPLNGARFGYTRTKLTNGLELIAGGHLDTGIITLTNHILASAQLLDPKTGKWTETGEMNIARFDHKATLLSNGKVLVEGGNGRPSIPGRYPPDLSSKELYDPTTGIWTVVTNK